MPKEKIVASGFEPLHAPVKGECVYRFTKPPSKHSAKKDRMQCAKDGVGFEPIGPFPRP